MFYPITLLVVHTSTVLSENMSQSDLNLINEIISSKITPDNTQSNDSVVFEYFYGNHSNSSRENSTDNLDFSIIDTDTVKRIYEIANKKNFIAESELNETILRSDKNYEAFFYVPYFVNKAMDLMKQSIYSTRYRLTDTRELRKRYSQDYCYNVAIFYGSLMQLRLKMDNVYATMVKLPYNTKFLWFLGLYERCVAMHVDVHYMVEKMFSLYGRHKKLVYGESGEMAIQPRMTFGKGSK